MIINHNCCIKLVPLVIFIYDARSHIHQVHYSLRQYHILRSNFQYLSEVHSSTVRLSQQSITPLTLRSEGSHFESPMGHNLSSLRFFVVLLSIPCKCRDGNVTKPRHLLPLSAVVLLSKLHVFRHRGCLKIKQKMIANNIIYNKPTRCNSDSIVFIKNYKYALHVSDALCVHLQEHYKLVGLLYIILQTYDARKLKYKMIVNSLLSRKNVGVILKLCQQGRFTPSESGVRDGAVG